jgi:hypothetical protein
MNIILALKDPRSHLENIIQMIDDAFDSLDIQDTKDLGILLSCVSRPEHKEKIVNIVTCKSSYIRDRLHQEFSPVLKSHFGSDEHQYKRMVHLFSQACKQLAKKHYFIGRKEYELQFDTRTVSEVGSLLVVRENCFIWLNDIPHKVQKGSQYYQPHKFFPLLEFSKDKPTTCELLKCTLCKSGNEARVVADCKHLVSCVSCFKKDRLMDCHLCCKKINHICLLETE